MKKTKIGYILLGFIIALTNCLGLMSMAVSAAAVTPTDGNIYYIKNLNSGLYLQVENDSNSDGANVCQATGTGSNGQKWIVNENGDGTIRLKSALDMSGGLALDIPNGVGDNLTNVQVWSSNGLAPQNFKLVDNGNGYYAIATQASNFERCLDVLSWSKDNGANVMQYDITMGENQLWAFEEASWPSSSSSDKTTTTTTTTTEKQTETTTQAQESAKSKSWNFSNSNFKNLGTLTGTQTVDGLKLIATSEKPMEVRAVNDSYCLALGGSGSTKYRAISLDISGKTTIKVTAQSSGSSDRTLNVVDAKGNVLGTINAGTSSAVGSIATSYSGTVYIYSAGSGINVFKVQIDTTGSLPSGSSSEVATETTTKKVTTTTEKQTETTTQASSGNSVTVSDFSSLVSAVKSMASKGGTVYVNAKSIDCTAQLALNSTKGNAVKIVGVKQSDGTYPILDFASFRNSTIGSTGKNLSSSGDAHVGVRITGSNYTLQNLIIQKAGDNGIQIKGSNANYNTVYNCIVRYNNDAGVQITNGASYNAMKFVYSYRNCDVYTRGGNSDGFAPKLGATTGNTFYGCYAWDNSDDGWDSFDKTDSGYTKDLTYEECACWNNGNPDVFTGKYDFENGKSLDTDLFLVELITKQDSSFASNYKNGKFSLPSGNFIKTDAGTISLSSWAGSSYDGNPNGFKYGSVNSKSNLVRTVKNCLSFNHGCKGFDNNNSSCTGSFTNCVSFDNQYNYYLPPFTMKKWSNIYGFNGSSKDKLPSGYSASTPSSSVQSSIRSTVKSTSNDIMNKCDKDIIPGEVYFNIY